MINEELGFSLWLDFIERDFLQKEFKELIEKGIINGATSNPAIFASSIATSPAYATQLNGLKNHSAKVKYEELAKTDIKLAAKALKPLYDKNKDGFVSIEVDPFFCDDTKKTVEEGLRLYQEIGMENVMIKIPATKAGYDAMKELISKGVHINATLIFSPKQAIKSLDAMTEGLKIWHKTKNKKDVQCVLSVFVSRFDRMLDKELETKGIQPGLLGIMNAAKIYNLVKTRNKKAIRTLFASTSIKGNAYVADYYIKGLMASNSINTAPLSTIKAFIKNPDHTPRLPIEDDKIEHFFKKVASAGIKMELVYEKLLSDGLKAFKDAFSNLLNSLD